MRIIKSTPNELNAVIILRVNKNDFELEYTYDNEIIAYDELIGMNEVQLKIEELRNKGLTGKVA